MHYQTLDLSEVDLSYAGRLGEGNPSLEAIQRLQAGDPISLGRRGDRWLIHDSAGTTVGRLARSYEPPHGTEFVRGEISAVLIRRREDSETAYQDNLRRDRWSVVVPELVFRSSPQMP
jgi:ATP-dependent DNA helicase RecQ